MLTSVSGKLDYFIPSTCEEYYDLKYTIAELFYQSYSQQAGLCILRPARFLNCFHL
jgi:hypothetical protein